MIISCPACGTRYVVPETAIGVEGRTVRCAKCKHSWFQEPQALDLTEQAETQPAAKAATPPPAPPPPPPPPAPEPEPEQAPEPEPAAEEPQTSEPPAPSIDHWRTEDRPEAVRDDPPPPPVPEPEPEPESAAEAEPEDTEPDSFSSETDPLADQSAPDPDYAFDEDEYDEEGSRFDYSPPFSRRRNSLKMWTIAAGIFALMASGTVLAVNYYGLPDWLPIQQPTFGVGKPELTLDFPASEQRKELLDSGEEIFRVRGSISNSGQTSMSVPSLLVVFRDERERNVGNWVVVPSKRELAPGESLNVTEAIADIPPAAKAAYIGWSPG